MPHSVLDQLFEFCVPFAQSLLAKRGEFSPFAASTRTDGTLNPIAFYDDENPKAEAVAMRLTEILTTLAEQNEITGSAICYSGIVSVPGNENRTAIIIAMERTSGVAVTLAIPYSKTALQGYEYEAPFRIAAASRVFPSSPC